MARFGAPLLVDEIRGKIGGVVFGGSRSGPSIRVRTTPSNPRTIHQSGVRSNLATAALAFKALSTTNAGLWNTAANSLTFSNGVGGSFKPSGINYFVQLASVFLAVTPGGSIPTTPPASPMASEPVTLTPAGAAGKITFTASAPNTSGITTEFLVQPLISQNRQPQFGNYRIQGYHAYVSGTLGHDVTLPPGDYATAYRFVKIATGERSALVQSGSFQVT